MRIRSRGKAARKQWSLNAHAAKARKRMADAKALLLATPAARHATAAEN